MRVGLIQAFHNVRPLLSDGMLALILLLFVRSSLGAAAHGDLGALFLAVQESCAALLVLFRPRAERADTTPSVALIAWLGTLLPLMLRPASSASALLALLGTALQLLGGVLVIAATLRLGHSFAVVPAHRGIQMGGLYRVVRHPIYAAYVLIFGGFVLAHLSLPNLLILAVWVWVQTRRIHAEELLLMRDAAYLAYQDRVRWRLLPGVW
jgi:protein-S-isoprenylcysteine O-methyltransferase Ste14